MNSVLTAVVTRRYLERGEAGWPAGLADLDQVSGGDQPRGLWVEGTAGLDVPAVAVVGARRASLSGLAVAHEIGRQVAACGAVVVSGFAVGIDAAAHRGALAAGGLSLAVLGCGLDQRYPRRHDQLRARLAAMGALVSEYQPEEPPDGWRFPRRNRIIAALARAVIVVEASARSGALSTARWAADLGREVFAVPGSIEGDMNIGSNRLIRDGARPYLEPADLAEVLPGHTLPAPAGAGEDPAGPERLLLDRLGSGLVHPDELCSSLGVGAAELSVRLGELELAGIVRSLPGGLIQRVRRRQ